MRNGIENRKKWEIKDMANGVKVSNSSMNADVDKLKTEMQKIRQGLLDLKDVMGELDGCWEGSAKAAYQKQVADDIRYMMELYTFLDKYIQALQLSGKIYLDSEKKVYGNIKKLRF